MFASWSASLTTISSPARSDGASAAAKLNTICVVDDPMITGPGPSPNIDESPRLPASTRSTAARERG